VHEASIIATEERAEMKMIEFFIARKIVVDGAVHSITKRRGPSSVQQESMTSWPGSSAARQSKRFYGNFCTAKTN
jgi:hypothetical protein